MHTLVMDLEPGYIGTEPGFLYRFNRDLWQTITSSHLVLHTKPGRIKNFKLSGVTRQVETTGAQLFDASKIPTTSSSGATVTNNGDGSFTVSGNGTLTSGFSHAIYLENEDVRRLFRPGEIYMAESPTTTRPYFEVGFFKNDQNVCDIRPVSAFLKATLPDDFFAPENNLRVRYIFYGAPGSDIIPGTIKPMMYQDGDGTWEPYSESFPSPSPEYPQDIQGVGKRTKNLFDKDAWYDFFYSKKQDIYWVDDDHTILRWRGSSGHDAVNNRAFELPFAKVPENTWISLSFDGRKTVASEFNETGICIAENDNTASRVIATIGTQDGTDWVHKYACAKVSGNLTLTMTYNMNGYCEFKNIQIELSDHETSYEPYGYRTDIMTKTKNLADISGAGLKYQLIPNGFILNAVDENHRVAWLPCNVKAGVKYTYRFRCKNSNPDYPVLLYLPIIKQYLTPDINGDVLSGTFTPTADTDTLGIYFVAAAIGTGVTAEITGLQVEEGNTPTTYQPYAYYTAPIYTSTPIYQGDKIELVDGQYCHVRNVGAQKYHADTVWSVQTEGHISTPRMYIPANCTADKMMSTFCKNSDMYVDSSYLNIATTLSLEEFAAIVSRQEQTVTYPLPDPIIEPLPAISQAAICNLKTYKGTTVIDTTDPLEPEITVSYRAAKKNFFNLEKVFSNLIPVSSRYRKYDLGLSPGKYKWSLQKNEFMGSGQYVLFTNDLEYDGSGITSGEIYQWIGHSTLANSCSTSGSFTITDEMYIAVHGGNVDAVKPLLKTLIIEKA